MSANSMDPNLLSTEGHFYDCIKLINDDDIYLCKYSPTGSLFAVRKTNLESVELELIREEVSVTRMLQHINLLPFLCCFVNKNQLWTVFPFAEYGCVSVLCQPTGLQELAIAFVIRDTLLALNYLHKRGIVHRAVRGSHILVTGSGRCLLSGLKYSTSVMVDGKWQSAIHQYPTNAEANLNFLAPEVLEQNLLGYNSKSDIYSLGIACCELANGCVPFQNMEPTEMLLDKLIGNFPRPLDSTCDEINSISTEGKRILENPVIKQSHLKLTPKGFYLNINHILYKCSFLNKLLMN